MLFFPPVYKKIKFQCLKNFLEPNYVEPKSPIYPALQPHSLKEILGTGKKTCVVMLEMGFFPVLFILLYCVCCAWLLFLRDLDSSEGRCRGGKMGADRRWRGIVAGRPGRRGNCSRYVMYERSIYFQF